MHHWFGHMWLVRLLFERGLGALYYIYEFTDWKERRERRAFWKRKRIGEYLPAVTLEALQAAMNSPPAVAVD